MTRHGFPLLLLSAALACACGCFERSAALSTGGQAPADPAARCGLDADAAAPSFAVEFQGEVSPLPLVSAFAMPGESLELEAVLADREARFTARAEGGTLVRLGPRRWLWTAPRAPGAHCIEIREHGAGEALQIRAFVLVPYDGGETLGGYRIGRYEPRPLRGDPAYRVPPGMVELTEANRDLWVSLHFQLHQFACKQEGGPPRYLVLTTRLLLKLELLLDAFRNRGIEADTLFVMSGYRTPYYNRLIGNSTRYTRHAYGDAADIFVDRDRDGRMDDLDGDGEVGLSDARLLYEIVDSLHGEPGYRPFRGGLASYGPRPHRGPFVHVDSRGRRARW